MSKKQPVVGSPAGIQKTIQEMLQQEMEKEKEKEKGMDAKLEIIMQGIQNVEIKQDNLAKDMQEIRVRVEKTDGKVEAIQQMMQKYESEMKEIKEDNLKRDAKTEEIETRLGEVEKDKSGLSWEIDHASFYLRFQNVEEEKDEDLEDLMANILAEALEITIEKMKEGMDGVYRIYSRYALKNKLPREIHIRFTRQTIKAQILQAIKNKPLKYKEKEIVVLKQVPKRVRDLRREYKNLTKELLKREINYRWLFPEGILFTWQGQRHRITSSTRAELFVYEHFRGMEEAIFLEQRPSRKQTEELSLLEEQEEGAVGGLPREQREVRSTRATNPTYKI